MEKGKLLGIGNPLLDLTVNGDAELLNKYHLKANDAVLANEPQKEIYNDMLTNHEVQFTAGGSVQNSLRVCQWILRAPKVCVFMGSVGRDQYSKILEKTALNDDIEVRYQYQDDVPTGTCAVIITSHEGNKRSLCANLAAAEKFTIDHIKKPENFKYVKDAGIYYISNVIPNKVGNTVPPNRYNAHQGAVVPILEITGGFFLTVSPETVFSLGEIATEQNKIFVSNLSAPFICKFYNEPLNRMITYSDIVFGNETEALTIGEINFNLKDLKEIALKLATTPKANCKRKRIVVITQGCHPVLYVKDGQLNEIQVPELDKEKVVDTNGAGDAFAGGFLSQLILGKAVEKCIECGIWAAGQIIQNSGCTFNKEVLYPG